MILTAIGSDLSCGGEVAFWGYAVSSWGYMAAAVLGIYALRIGHSLVFNRWTSFAGPSDGGFVYCFVLHGSRVAVS